MNFSLRPFVFYVFLLSFLSTYQLKATHNRAGEITYRQIDQLTIEATITTYSKESSVAADRDSLELCWGDGQCEWVLRVNGPPPGPPFPGESLPNDTKKNIYVATHRYAGPGHFKMFMTDANRNDGVCNINSGNSVNIPLHLETTVTLLDPIFQGPNNSPVLLQPPIDIGCVGQPFVHYVNAYDPDGDSLAFRLIVPLEGPNNDEVPVYQFPNQIAPGPDNNVLFDESIGEFLWLAPQQACEYNIAMYVIEYRNGQPIDTLIRDMQILIEECDNLPPEIEVIEEICVIAGETIEIDVTATAPLLENDQLVNLTATGGPFELEFSPATFNGTEDFQAQPLVRQFRWETKCEHIEEQAYSVVFRSADNVSIISGSPDPSFLSTLKILRIKVVGPPPQDLMVETESAQVELTWENPYLCEDAMEEYFRGFTVWRRIGSNQFPPDTCTPGLDGRGYTKITQIPIQDIVEGRYYYLDLDVERGRTYCYRVLGNFARLTSNGFEYNKVESLPSEEICVQLDRDIPLITKVSVTETDPSNGGMEIRWTKPNPEDLDTIANPGPYVYELYRATGITSAGFELIPDAVFSSPTYSMANDTFYFDSFLNTSENPYSYQIVFYATDTVNPLGNTPATSSVFLTVMSTDNVNNLTWDEDVPWDNYLYEVYRQNPSGDFELIGTSITQSYSDEDLLNGIEYCYQIQSIGSYGIEGTPDTLFNFSQEACGIPLDTVPPCPPQLMVSNICDESNPQTPETEFENDLLWLNPNFICPETDDVVGYNVYFTPIEGGNFDLIASFDLSTDTTLTHKPDFGIAGCYAVTAVDTFNNESRFSNIICVDNCPEYSLPNVFTPNNDGQNDLYIPFPYRFIERIELKVYNRWGNLVFETSNPDILWDGTNTSGKELNEGVYFYACRVFENRVSGVTQRPDILKGYIELIR